MSIDLDTDIQTEPKNILLASSGKGVSNLSTVSVLRTRGMIPARTVQVWGSLFTPLNHKYASLIESEKEADEALNHAVETILADMQAMNFKYVLFMDDDNIPPQDGLLTLLKTIGEYDGISGLYVTKDPAHWPLMLGDPKDLKDWTPQGYREGVHECNGMGMGFVLLKLEIFKAMPKPWFKIVNSPQGNIRRMNEDVYFYYHARQAGYRFSCNCDVKVGHLNVPTGEVFYPPEAKKKEPTNGKAS